MYEEFYGLNADPFRLSSDHHFCFSHRSYARAKAYVQYALYRAEGFVMVTGRPGTGKTTLINDLLASLPDKEVVAGTLVSTQLEADDLLLMTGHAFGLDLPSQQKALVLQRLMEFLKQQHRQGLRTLLIIDEAQDLAPSALEELRLLTNLQLDGEPLLQIALLGQESLRGLVRSPAMEQVHQRLIAAWQLDPLEPEETIGYVRHRLERAGWRGNPSFEPGILPIIQEFSQGVPRRINLICSRLLLHGYIGELHTLTAEDAQTVARDLHREELALPDYDPEAAPAGTAGANLSSRGPSGEPESGATAWSTIDQGLFWTAPEKRPEAGTGPAEPPAPEQAAQPGAGSEDSALPEEAPRPESEARAVSPTDSDKLSPDLESEPLEPLGTVAGRSAGTGTEPAVRAEPRASEFMDSTAHIVPDKNEHWPHAAGDLAPRPAQRPGRSRSHRVLPWFLLILISSVALIATLFLSRGAVEESPLADLSPALANLNQWWHESSAAAINMLQSLRTDDDGTPGAPAAVTADDSAIVSLPLDTPSGDSPTGPSADGQLTGTTSLTPAEVPAPGGDAFTAIELPATQDPYRTPAPEAEAGSTPGAVTETGAGSVERPADPTTAQAIPPSNPTLEVPVQIPPPASGSATGTTITPPASARDVSPDETTRDAPPDPQGSGEFREPSAPQPPPAVATTSPPAVPERAPSSEPASSVTGIVFFRVNSVTVDPQFEALLHEISETLAESEEAYAEIVGYTDTTGPTEYNLYLSNQRAQAVANELMRRGIPSGRLRIEGQGPREPELGTDGYRAEDRVVEITIRYESRG